jgi:hypothetical protein
MTEGAAFAPAILGLLAAAAGWLVSWRIRSRIRSYKTSAKREAAAGAAE